MGDVHLDAEGRESSKLNGTYMYTCMYVHIYMYMSTKIARCKVQGDLAHPAHHTRTVVQDRT